MGANLGGRSVGGIGCDDEQARWNALLASSAELSADETLFASAADCDACDGTGLVEGRLFWCSVSAAYVAQPARCAACHGYGVVEVATGLDCDDERREQDAAADAALALSDREPGAVAAACDLVVAGAVGLASLLAAVVEAAVEAHQRADERDGESVAAAGRDPSALTSTSAPVVALRARRPVATSRAA